MTVTLEDGIEYGVIDETGKYVVEPKYQLIKFDDKGNIWFRSNFKYGMLDNKGNVVIEPQFDLFRDGWFFSAD